MSTPPVWENLPEGALVLVDTAPIIYLLEGNEHFLPRFWPLFQAGEDGRLQIATTVVTLAEVLAGPLKAGKDVLAARYEEALRQGLGWRLLDLTAEVAARAARLRITYGLKLPDAFQLAATLESGAAALVTHDRDFGRAADEVAIIGL